MKIKPRIDLLFVVAGVLLFLIAFLVYPSGIDLNVHDTYFVIANLHIAFVLLLLFLLFGFVYFIFQRTNRPLKRVPGLIHYFISTFTILLFILSPLLVNHAPRRYNPNDPVYENLHIINLIITISAILFLVAQAIFLANILRSIFTKASVVPEK
jgi:heme/copper-type cytochrome/quinol oxidase subunit 1